MIKFGQDPQRMLQNNLALFGKYHSTPMSVEQTGTEFCFQKPYVTAKGRLSGA